VQLPAAQPSLPGMGNWPGKTNGDELRRRKHRLRACVHIPKDLPVSQNEIEVIAALLDDWEMVVADVPEAAE
jgi:hypothetical protein